MNLCLNWNDSACDTGPGFGPRQNIKGLGLGRKLQKLKKRYWTITPENFMPKYYLVQNLLFVKVE